MTEPTKAPHPHAALIKAWADGAVIEVLTRAKNWVQPATPIWAPTKVYRIKPEPPKPIVVVETYHYRDSDVGVLFGRGPLDNGRQVAFTVDPATTSILSVELVKE